MIEPEAAIANLGWFIVLLLLFLITGRLARMVWWNLRLVKLWALKKGKPYSVEDNLFHKAPVARDFSRKRKFEEEDNLFHFEDNRFHVLLVDNDATRFHTTLLSRHPCRVSTVLNVMGALGFLGIVGDPEDGLIPDMIIADYDMPALDMTGYILLQLIKKAPKTKDLPVVILLSDEMWDRSDKILSAGAAHVFKKPLTDENVMTLMNGKSRGNVCEPLV